MRPLLTRIICLIATVSLARITFGQSLQATPVDAVRVTVSVNADGSRTIYEFDSVNHKAVATTRDRDGKLRGKIDYALDDAGRFASGDVFGPDKQLRFKSIYKYGDTGRLAQEMQLNKGGEVLNKIVYAYDQAGKPTGYSVYDASGKLLSQTSAPAPAASPAKKKSR
jgi:hypothetical protein